MIRDVEVEELAAVMAEHDEGEEEAVGEGGNEKRPEKREDQNDDEHCCKLQLPLRGVLARSSATPKESEGRGASRSTPARASTSLDQAALTAIIFRVVTCGAGILTSSIPFACFASTWATSTPSGSWKLRWNAPYASSRTK